MAKPEQSSWIDDAFDDKKAQAELEEAKTSSRLGCLLVVVVVVAVAFIGFAVVGMVGALESL